MKVIVVFLALFAISIQSESDDRRKQIIERAKGLDNRANNVIGRLDKTVAEDSQLIKVLEEEQRLLTLFIGQLILVPENELDALLNKVELFEDVFEQDIRSAESIVSSNTTTTLATTKIVSTTLSPRPTVSPTCPPPYPNIRYHDQYMDKIKAAIAPCEFNTYCCNNYIDEISCYDRDLSKVNFTQMFAKLNEFLPNEQKMFDELTLWRTKNSHLDKSMFEHIHFKQLNLQIDNQSIDLGHMLAGEHCFLEKLSLMSTDKLNPAMIKNIVNELNFLNYLDFYDYDEVAITRGMFDGMDQLADLRFYGTKLSRFESRAFENLPKLNALWLGEVNFTKVQIPDYAFAMKPSDKRFVIYFQYDQIGKLNFTDKALLGIQRPATLWINDFLSKENIVLDEKVIRPFLEDNKSHYVELFNTYIDCNDCRNYWIYLDKSIQDSIYRNEMRPICGNDIDDKDYFKNCKK